MKAFLVTKGYRLFRDIWSDQPPIFTFLLAEQFKRNGPSVEAGRTLVMLMTAGLVLSLYQTVRMMEGMSAAVAAVLFITASAHFINLSSAVMIGLPAIALGMAAVWMLFERRAASSSTVRQVCLFASALFMALSIQTKLFTLALLPAILTLILLPNEQSSSELYWPPLDRLKTAAVWAFSFVLLAGTIGLLTSEDWKQLIIPHLRLWITASADKRLYPLTFTELFRQIYSHELFLFLFSGLGLGLGLRHRRWHVIIPVVWFATTVVALINFQPLRDHYAPLLSIPLCWSAAIGVGMILEIVTIRIRASSRRVATALIFILLAVIIPITVQSIAQIQYDINQTRKEDVDGYQILDQLRRYKNQTHWVYTDFPIYPFETGLLVPPEIAVITEKRRRSNVQFDFYLLEMFRKYQPEQILIGRFYNTSTPMDYLHTSYSPAVMTYIHTFYTLVWQTPNDANIPFPLRHYILKGIKRIDEHTYEQ